MTGTQLLAYTRFLIQETSATFWTDANLLISLNAALREWTAIIQKSDNKYYLKSAALALLAGANTAALPSDCTGIVYYVQDNANDYRPMRWVPFNTIQHNLTDDPSGICLAGGYVYFNAKPSSAKSYTIFYFRTPTAIAAGSTEIDFPVLHHELLAYEASYIAYIRDNHDPSILMPRRKQAMDSFMTALDENIEGVPKFSRGSINANFDSY
jgi:hypothetical protein